MRNANSTLSKARGSGGMSNANSTLSKARGSGGMRIKGALAHLARAFDWQSKGDEFESRMLHTTKAEPFGSAFIV